MSGDEVVRARVAARRADLARSAARRRHGGGRLRTLHLHLWWAVRPRRGMACLVTTPDGAAVLGGRLRPGRPVAR